MLLQNAFSNYCHRNNLKQHAGGIQGGILNHVSVTFIDKICSSDPWKRGDYWRQTLNPMTPYCLGIEDSV